nr:hypothetical protein BaRGS_012076 [Batillaria attramentaria]
MVAAFNMEVAAGLRDVIGYADMSEMKKKNPAYAACYRVFRRCHAVSGMLTVLSLAANTVARPQGSGQIEFPEFVEMMRDRFGALEYREMCIKDAFQTLDKDKNGYITYDELRAAMLEKGEPLDEKEFQKVIDQLDVNHDGKIEYEAPLA